MNVANVILSEAKLQPQPESFRGEAGLSIPYRLLSAAAPTDVTQASWLMRQGDILSDRPAGLKPCETVQAESVPYFRNGGVFLPDCESRFARKRSDSVSASSSHSSF
jgi:hypothetical protein